jgi:hypothetical protein
LSFPFILVFSLIFYDRLLSTTITSASFGTSGSASFEQFFLGLISGLAIFLIQDFIRRKWDKMDNRKKVIRALIAELEENLSISAESTYAPLSSETWRQAVNEGLLPELKTDLSKKLLALYSKIGNKNNLLSYYQIGVQNDKQLGVTDADGKITKPLVEILGELRAKIENEINTALPLLKSEIAE